MMRVQVNSANAEFLLRNCEELLRGCSKSSFLFFFLFFLIFEENYYFDLYFYHRGLFLVRCFMLYCPEYSIATKIKKIKKYL